MGTRYLFLLIVLLFIGDLLIINSSFTAAYFWLNLNNKFNSENIKVSYLLYFNISWIFWATLIRLYSRTTAQSTENVYAKSWRSIILHIVTACCFLFYNNSASVKKFLLITFLLELIGFLISRFIITAFEQYHERISRFKKTIAVIGYNETGIKLAEYFKQNKLSYNFAGFVDYDNHVPEHYIDNNCSIYAFSDFVAEHDVREVYSTVLPNDENYELKSIIDVAEHNCVRVKFVANGNSPIDGNLYLENYIGNMKIVNFRTEPLELLKNQILKRCFDILFSLLVITLIFSWLIPIIAIMIKINSKGPVFFLQTRAGKDNKPFKIFKFRTMTVTEGDSEYVQATKNDARVTKVGAFLRKTSLDEIPQFINVLMGKMSVVGPRPHPLKLNDEYMVIIDKYMVRHYSKPGITGWAQVNGYRGETFEDELMIKRVEHDIHYIENWSMMLDLKILFLTVINMIKGEEKAF